MAANDIPLQQKFQCLAVEEYLKQMKEKNEMLQDLLSKIALIVNGWMLQTSNGFFYHIFILLQEIKCQCYDTAFCLSQTSVWDMVLMTLLWKLPNRPSHQIKRV
jgi:hypothetical protein